MIEKSIELVMEMIQQNKVCITNIANMTIINECDLEDLLT
jgi:hypothetical protein